MGMSLKAGGGGGRRRRGRARAAPMSEINVTPMVDVMLVLLIIFMVAAPLLTVGVPIELPQSQGKQLESNKEPLTVSVSSNGDVFIGETKVAMNELSEKLKAIAKNGVGRADFRARRQGHNVRHGDAGDGPHQCRRVQEGIACDRGGRGEVSRSCSSVSPSRS